MRKILVIDDERDVLEVVRSVLKTKGYSVRCAEGGEEGLRQAEAEKFDLIIVDLMMPRVSGLEVIKRLKAKDNLRSVPIIVLSAVGVESDKDEGFWARGLGVDEYINKPFEPLDLLGRVEYIFRRGEYVSNREGDLTPRPHRIPSRDDNIKHAAINFREAKPSEVVKAYVEAWNNRDWTTEYQCLDPKMMGSFPMVDYVARREQYYAEEQGQQTQQAVKEVSDEKIQGEEATVVYEKEERRGPKETRTRVTSTLKKTDKGWKIFGMKEEPIRQPR